MLEKAAINSKGAILLGRNIACDSFDDARSLRVVTHAHHDHLTGLQQSLRKCKAVIMTPATKDLLEVMRGRWFLMRGNIKTLNYEEPLTHENERLTLHFADHILGTAQVLVEDADGTRLLYTSDFKLPKTPIINTDVLVIEATYGNPVQVRPFEEVVETALITLVEQGIRQGPVYIFGYHGKLQEVMQILRAANIKAPFIVPEKVFRISKICEKHGMKLGKYILFSEEEAQSLLKKKDPFVAFYHMNSRRYIGKEAFRIFVSGWEFSSPRRQIGENEHIIALSDHSDFKGLLQYVEESKPRLVITDNYRVGAAKTLAKQIEKRLRIPARPLPKPI
jgi:putative mRNA 3-end processing factor